MLDEILGKQNVIADEVLGIENILGDIKHNLNKFVTYCKKHKKFIMRIIQLALNTQIQQIQSKNLKDIVYVAVQFLSLDEDCLSELFLQHDEIQRQSQLSQIKQIIQIQVQSQQRVGKFQLLKALLNVLNNPEKNITCLGYLYKILSFLIRKEPQKMIQFFQTNIQSSKLIQSNICYDSIASLLVQILTTEDKTKQYRFQKYKQQIFTSFLSTYIYHLNDEQFIQGAINFVEQVLNNTKQSYYQYFQDFKRCANILVSEVTMQKFYQIVCNNCSPSLKNSTIYIHMILRRINSEKQDNSYYGNNNNNLQPTMNFEIDFLYKQLDSIIKRIQDIYNNKEHSTISKCLYLEMIVELMKNNNKFGLASINITNALNSLFVNQFQLQKCLKESQTNGIIKTTLYQIILLTINKATPQQILSFIKQIDIFKDYFQKTKNPFEAHKNNDESICFENKILILLKNKSEQTASILKWGCLSLQFIEQKYKTILAAPQQKQIKSNAETPQFKIYNSGIESPIIHTLLSQTDGLFKKNVVVPPLGINQNKLQIIVDDEKIVIEKQQVERIDFGFPKNNNLIGFMGLSSPRSLQLALVRSDCSLEQIPLQKSGKKNIIIEETKAQNIPIQYKENRCFNKGQIQYFCKFYTLI